MVGATDRFPDKAGLAASPHAAAPQPRSFPTPAASQVGTTGTSGAEGPGVARPAYLFPGRPLLAVRRPLYGL